MTVRITVLAALALVLALAGMDAPARLDRLEAVPEVDLSVADAPVRDALESVRERYEMQRATLEDEDALAALYAHLANVYYANGFHGPARIAYRNASRLAPTHPEPRYMLAMTEYRLGNTDEAIRQYTVGLEIESTHIPSLVRRARIHLERGEMDRAETDFLAAVELSPDSAAAHAGLAWVAAYREDHQGVVEHLGHALEHDPAATRLHSVLANAYRALGDEASAQRHDALQGDGVERMFDPVLDRVMLQSLDAGVISGMGNRRLEQGFITSAENLFARARELEPGNEEYVLQHAESIYLLGLQSLMHDRCDEAGDQLARVLDLDVVYAPAYLVLARLRATCLGANEAALEEALEWSEELYHQMPGLDTAETLAMVYAALGRFDDAVDLQAQAMFEALKEQILDDRPGMQVNMRRYQESRPAASPLSFDPSAH